MPGVLGGVARDGGVQLLVTVAASCGVGRGALGQALAATQFSIRRLRASRKSVHLRTYSR